MGMLARISRTPPIPDGDRETLFWLINLRYKVGLMLLAVLFASTLVTRAPLESTLGLSVVGAIYLLNSVIYALLLGRPDGARHERRVRVIKALQAPEKILICTAAIYFAGGVLTPLFILYPLAMFEAIILLDPKGVYRTGALSIAFYCGLALLEAWKILPILPGYFGMQRYFNTNDPTTYALCIMVVSSVLIVTAFIGNRIALVMRLRETHLTSRLQDLHTLYDVANGLNRIMDENEVASYLANTLKTLQSASMCLICVEGREGTMELRAGAGMPPGAAARLRTLDPKAPLLARVLEQGLPVVVEDTTDNADFESVAIKPNIRSLYMYPIKEEDKVTGVIRLSFDKVKPLSPEYQDLMTTIAAQAGIALQRARLLGNAQRMADEMSTLYDVGLYTGSTLSKEEVIRRTSDNIEKLMKPDAYYIALYDSSTEMLSFEVFFEQGREMPRMRASLDKGGLTGRIISSGEPLLIQDWLASGGKYNSIAMKTGADMFSYLGVPMKYEGRVIGVISVQCVRPMAFNERDERLLIALAAQTAMALENARLHESAQDQAKYDSLTGVYNHGCFVQLVREAVEKSDEDDSQVALIMLDIDHFKTYNDTYGHVTGDNVLRMIANALKSSAREDDAVGRWGGEEFGVLLAGASVDEGKQVARRIRRAVAGLYLVDAQGHTIPNPTVSQGLSSYPFPSVTANSLIEQADAALYHAKKHGRNQIVVHDATGIRDATITTDHLAARTRPIAEHTTTTADLTVREPSGL